MRERAEQSPPLRLIVTKISHLGKKHTSDAGNEVREQRWLTVTQKTNKSEPQQARLTLRTASGLSHLDSSLSSYHHFSSMETRSRRSRSVGTLRDYLDLLHCSSQIRHETASMFYKEYISKKKKAVNRAAGRSQQTMDPL